MWDREYVQIIIYGMPAVWPTPDEEDRVKFAECEMYGGEGDPKRNGPTCEAAYKGTGQVVLEP